MSSSGRSSDDATFEATRERQILLGLELTARERLAWLEARRAEITRLQRLMPKRGTPDSECG